MIFPFVLVILLLCSAFFSGSETAIFSLSKIRVKRLQLEKAGGAKLLARLLTKPRRLIISILIGNLLVNILASSISSSLAIDLFGKKGIAISIGVMTFLILTFGEITPKIIAIRNPEKISLMVVPAIAVINRILFPISKAFQFIADLITPLFSRRIKPEKSQFTDEELRKTVEIGRREGVLDLKEEEMLKGIFNFGDKAARNVVTPLKAIVAVDINTPLDTIRSIIVKKELSRMPVFENNLDNIIGMLYAKDLIAAGQRGPFALRDILRKPFYVPEDIRLDELLRKFRANRIHMALVRDRKGKFVGLLTLQDLLEEIIGKIKDIKGT